MPTYNIVNKDTGEYSDTFFQTWSAFSDWLKENPHYEQLIS